MFEQPDAILLAALVLLRGLDAGPATTTRA
jgi:hypothetical protein